EDRNKLLDRVGNGIFAEVSLLLCGTLPEVLNLSLLSRQAVKERIALRLQPCDLVAWIAQTICRRRCFRRAGIGLIIRRAARRADHRQRTADFAAYTRRCANQNEIFHLRYLLF